MSGRKNMSRRARLMLVAGLGALVTACGGGGTDLAYPIIPPPPVPPAPTDPSDPAYYETAEYYNQYGLYQMNVSHAYANDAFGENITIAVIDSGILGDYAELEGRISPDSVSIFEELGGTLGTYTHPHGTMIAATIAANRDGSGMHGVAPESTILAIQVDQGVENPDIGGSFPLYTENEFAAAIDYAIAHNADIISLSIARPPEYYEANGTQIYAALRRAVDAGIIITIGSGNYSAGTPVEDRIVGTSIPAAFADDPLMNGQIVIVPALNRSLLLADFSARAGIYADYAISAAGEDIYITLDGETSTSVNGTSFSGPQIAGALALLMGAFPNLEGTEALQILFDTATDLGVTGLDDIYGHGVPNMEAAFAPQGQAPIKTAGGAQNTSLDALMSAPTGAFGDWVWQSGLYDDAVFQDSYRRVYSVREMLDQTTPIASRLNMFESAARNGQAPVRTTAIGQSGQVSLRAARDLPVLYNQLDPEMGQDRAAISLQFSLGDLNLAAGRGFSAPGPVGGAGLSVLSSQVFAGATANLGLQDSWTRFNYDLGNWTFGLRNSGGARSGFQSVSLMRHAGAQTFGLEVGNTREDDAAWGGSVAGRFGSDDTSQSSFQAAVWNGALPGGWHGAGRLEMASTELNLPGGINIVEAPLASAWTLAAHRDLFGGRFGLTLNQPLRAERGAVSTSLATSVDADWNLIYETRIGRLSPSGREVSAEAAYHWTVLGGADASISTRLTSQPGHMARADDDVSIWFGLRSRR
jgi:hypothetical protein